MDQGRDGQLLEALQLIPAVCSDKLPVELFPLF